MTVLDLIKRSMRLLGALNIGDVPTSDEQQDALFALNAMVDAWGTERLLMYTTTRQVFNILSGQQVYQIGPNAPDWVAPRPMYIDAAGLIIGNSDPTQVLERPIEILRTDKDWARIRVKGVLSTLPTKLYYDHGFSNPNSAVSDAGSGNVALWPVPSENNLIALYTPLAVTQFTSLTQTVLLPPGYARALPSNLAVEMAPEFDREPSAALLAIADSSKASLKRANVPAAMRTMRTDIGGRHGHFDWMIGEER